MSTAERLLREAATFQRRQMPLSAWHAEWGLCVSNTLQHCLKRTLSCRADKCGIQSLWRAGTKPCNLLLDFLGQAFLEEASGPAGNEPFDRYLAMALRSLEAMVITAGQVDTFVAVRSPCMAGCGGQASCTVWQELFMLAKALRVTNISQACASGVSMLLTSRKLKAAVAALCCFLLLSVSS